MSAREERAAPTDSSGKKHGFDKFIDDQLVTLIKSIRVFNNEDCSFIGLFQHENKRAPNREEMLEYLDEENIYEKYPYGLCHYSPYYHLLGGDRGCLGCDPFNEYRDADLNYDLNSPENCELHFEKERIQREEEEERRQQKRDARKKFEHVGKIGAQTLREGDCPVLFEGMNRLEISKICGHGLSQEAREQLPNSKCPICQIPDAFRKDNIVELPTQQGKIKRVADDLSSLGERTGIIGKFADRIGLGGKKTRRRKHKKSVKKNKTKRTSTKAKAKKSRKNKTKRK